MSPAPSFGSGSSSQGMFNKSERNKLIFMSVLLVVVVGIFLTSLMKKGEYEAQERDGMPPTAAAGDADFVETVVVPEFDPALIAGKVADTRPDDRVLLESGPFDALFAFAREYGDTVFRGGAGVTLDAQAGEALAAEPAAHRADPFRVRGTIEEAKSRTRPDGVTETRGWLALEGGQHAAFAIEELPETLIVGDFVRVDGFFLKLFRGELGEEWVEGPMVVGRRAVKAYPNPPGVFDPEDLTVALLQVTDDSFDEMTKLDDAALKAQWKLLDRVRREGLSEPDWANPIVLDAAVLEDLKARPREFDGKVFELSNTALAELHKNPDILRGRPFNLPISKNMGSWTASPGENPARLDAITTGWIANMTWTSHTGLIQYVMPGASPAMRTAKFVTGRGYFLKKLAYEPKEGELALAPLFVMQTVQPFNPQEDGSIDSFMMIVLFVMLLLIGLVPVLLVRDRRRSAALQKELVRRRQERRQRRQDGPAPAPANPAG